MSHFPHTWPRPRRLQRGLSLVELMVGIAIGLFIVAAASMLTTSHLDDNRRLMLETQVQQELRAAADIVARDLRRAGYWSAAQDGVSTPDRPTRLENPNAALSTAPGESSDDMLFAYTITDTNSAAGFRFDQANGVAQIKLGPGNYQPLTDPQLVSITTFDVVLRQTEVSLAAMCVTPCVEPACPKQLQRRYEFQIAGTATHDSSVRRSLSGQVRLPNDIITGACP